LQAAGARDDVGDVLIPKKYFAAHYLSFAINKNWHAGFFETVVFSRRNQFEFQYLNPVILYRTVEGALGSPDNVLIGFNVSGNLFKKVQLYGQLLLDEFYSKNLLPIIVVGGRTSMDCRVALNTSTRWGLKTLIYNLKPTWSCLIPILILTLLLISAIIISHLLTPWVPTLLRE
jgi:hypothetical protein